MPVSKLGQAVGPRTPAQKGHMVAVRLEGAQDVLGEGGKILRPAVPLDTQVVSSHLAEAQGEGAGRKVTFPEDHSACTDCPPAPFSLELIVVVPHTRDEVDNEDDAVSYASDEVGKRDDAEPPAEVVAQTQRHVMPRLCSAISMGADGQFTHRIFNYGPTTTHMLQVS